LSKTDLLVQKLGAKENGKMWQKQGLTSIDFEALNLFHRDNEDSDYDTTNFEALNLFHGNEN
jgi:hypothetical protein